MSNLDRRIKRLEEHPDVKRGPQMIYVRQNLEDGEGEETPYFVRISSELWAEALGFAFTEDHIRRLKDEYRDGKI